MATLGTNTVTEGPAERDTLLLLNAVSAVQSGKKTTARYLLRQASEENPRNELVWLWRASLSRSRSEALANVERVLEINPENQKALEWLPRLEQGAASAEGDTTQEVSSLNGASTVHEAEAAPAEVVKSRADGAEAGELKAEHEVEEVPRYQAEADLEIVPAEAPVADPAGEAALEDMGGPGLEEDPQAGLEPDTSRRDEETWDAGGPVAETRALAATASAEAQVAGEVPLQMEATPSDEVSELEEAELVPARAAPQKPLADEPEEESIDLSCRFCSSPLEDMDSPCESCGAVNGLGDLALFSKPKKLDLDTIRSAMNRFHQTLQHGPDFNAHLGLGLGALHLGRSADAAVELANAFKLEPSHPGLKSAVYTLFRRRLVMVVDDSATVRKMVSTILERAEYRVSFAEDGMQALARLDEMVPDLVLLDITMPRMGGYQVCKVIRENEVTKGIPVVMLSGKDGFFDKVKGRMVGATDYVTKPFKKENLLSTIERCIEQSSHDSDTILDI